MPILKKQPKGTIVKNQLPQKLIDQYRGYLGDVEADEEGVLEFEDGGDIKLARRALQEAAEQIGTYLKINKIRGRDNCLRFQFITKKEYEANKKMAQERGAKIKGKPKPKRKIKAK